MPFPSTAMSADILGWVGVFFVCNKQVSQEQVLYPEEIVASGFLPTFSFPSDFHKGSCVQSGERLQH